MRIVIFAWVMLFVAGLVGAEPARVGEYTVTNLDALPYVENEYSKRFRFDSYDNPKLKELREKYRLDEVVTGGKDEFEKQVLLLDWVNHRLKKFGRPSTDARGAIKILEAVEEGHTFFCAHYADVFVSAAASLGWVDRAMALRRPDNVGSGSTEHASTEIWSNQYRKWIMLDPTFAMYVEKDGVPLSAYEIRQEWFYRDGKDLVFVLDKDRKRYRKSDMPVLRGKYAGFGDLVLDGGAIDPYAFIGYIPNTDIMDRGYDYGAMFITQDKLCEGTKWHKRVNPKDPAVEPYFPINQAAIELAAEGDGIRVGLKTLTPNFKAYLGRIDGAEWKEVESSFLWKPKTGQLQVKAVNKFGVEGPVSTVEVQSTAQSKLEPIKTVEIGKNRELRVNGKPFFPLGSWAQQSHRFPLLRSFGFNTFVGGRAKEYCVEAEKAGGYTMTHFDRAMKGHPALLTWTHSDEPDLGIDKGKPRKTAQEVVDSYKRIKEFDDTRPVFLNLTSGFMERGRPLPAERKAYYELVVNGADILSFDYYPIYGWNRPDRLTWVADGVTQLRALGGERRPVFEFIETSKGGQFIDYEKQIAVLPMHTRAEVWMAIIRGVTGIMYFTHAWKPKFNEFEPTEEMRAELKRLNEQITRLAPAILSDAAQERVSITFADGLAGEVMAKSYDGSIYLFANNLDLKWRNGKATIEVEGLKRGTKIEVIDESRQITADEGNFSDHFDTLAVHIYRIALPQ